MVLHNDNGFSAGHSQLNFWYAPIHTINYTNYSFKLVQLVKYWIVMKAWDMALNSKIQDMTKTRFCSSCLADTNIRIHLFNSGIRKHLTK